MLSCLLSGFVTLTNNELLIFPFFAFACNIGSILIFNIDYKTQDILYFKYELVLIINFMPILYLWFVLGYIFLTVFLRWLTNFFTAYVLLICIFVCGNETIERHTVTWNIIKFHEILLCLSATNEVWDLFNFRNKIKDREIIENSL